MKTETNIKPNILHLLKISLPNLSGYSIRSHYIISKQEKFANAYALTNPYQYRKNKPDIYDNVIYYRYPLNLKINSYRNSIFAKYFHIMNIEHLIYYSLMKTPMQFIRMLIKQKNIHLIHAHSNYQFAKFGEIIARERNIPFIYEARGFWEDTQAGEERLKENGFQYMKMRGNETRFMKKADLIIVLCKMMEKELVSRGIDKNKIYVIQNAVDIKNFTPIPPNVNLKKKLKLNDKLIVGYIGSIREIEGIEILIKAIAIINKSIKNVVLLLIGSFYNNAYKLKLENLIKKLNVKDSIHFIGQVEQNKIKDFYSIVDIIVIPRINTRVNRLVTPLKQLEAMAMQKVVITSDLAALREIIKPSISGDVFKAGDVNSLVNKIIEYLNDKNLREKLGESARTFVQKDYNWDVVIEKYHLIYNKIIE